MGESILQLRQIRKSFDNTEVLKGIDLEVAQGEFITLLGASGCGKTTTLRIIAGLELPDAGQVILEGQDITNREPNKRDVNTVFQNYALFRYNEVTDTRLNQDGMAYDADSGDGTVYESNYSRQNEGGCVMFCLQEAIHNTFRDNISYDDLGGTISPSENPDALLQDNVYYVRRGVPFVRKNMDGGSFTQVNDRVVEL